MRLQPKTYDWRGSGAHGVGFIAQDVQTVIPSLVYPQDGLLMLSADGMIPYLVSAIQELNWRVEQMKAAK